MKKNDSFGALGLASSGCDGQISAPTSLPLGEMGVRFSGLGLDRFTFHAGSRSRHRLGGAGPVT